MLLSIPMTLILERQNVLIYFTVCLYSSAVSLWLGLLKSLFSLPFADWSWIVLCVHMLTHTLNYIEYIRIYHNTSWFQYIYICIYYVSVSEIKDKYSIYIKAIKNQCRYEALRDQTATKKRTSEVPFFSPGFKTDGVWIFQVIGLIFAM